MTFKRSLIKSSTTMTS